MITGLHIENFKSLANFDMHGFEKFVCVIGVNGAGKSTLLQAFDFVSNLAYGRSGFRSWKKSDIATNGSGIRTSTFRFDFDFNGTLAQWEGRFNPIRWKCSEERFRILGTTAHDVLTVRDGRMVWGENYVREAEKYPKDISKLTYEGSIVAAFEFSGTIVQDVKTALRSLGSLELLSPERLRKAGQSGDSIAVGGDGLPGFLSSLDDQSAQDLGNRMSAVYPDVVDYQIKRKRFGWKKLLIDERYFKSPIAVEHVNDGYLRMLAMLSQRYAKRDFVLFDEIENGINQEIIEKLIANLLDYNGKQVMITTHSPLILNYLPDDVARQSVFLLSKDENGHTKASRFFDLPGMAEKLALMGPGEVMNDTCLLGLR